MPQSVKILSTKIISKNNAERLTTCGVNFIQENFIETKSILSPEDAQLINALPQQKAVVVFTSANAVKAVAEKLFVSPQWKVFCIGGKTKNLIEEVFPECKIVDFASYGKDLSEKIITAGVKEITFFSGTKRLNTLPDMLTKNRIIVNEMVVYETKLTPKKLDTIFSGILFFSPSAVESFFSVNQITKGTVLFSIGSTTTSALGNYSEYIQECSFPSEEAMTNLVRKYYYEIM